jgi:hypothetical protein
LKKEKKYVIIEDELEERGMLLYPDKTKGRIVL